LQQIVGEELFGLILRGDKKWLLILQSY